MPSRLNVRVQPRASLRDVQREVDGSLRVRVTSPAEGGKANQAVGEVLAKALGVPKSTLRVVSGHRGRSKVVEVDLEPPQLQERLDGLPTRSAAPGE
jgi:uncharacterized protein YggU (UPF0235/DUF167 family)